MPGLPLSSQTLKDCASDGQGKGEGESRLPDFIRAVFDGLLPVEVDDSLILWLHHLRPCSVVHLVAGGRGWLYIMRPKDADWMANSVAPDPTDPSGAVYLRLDCLPRPVCRKLRNIMVPDYLNSIDRLLRVDVSLIMWQDFLCRLKTPQECASDGQGELGVGGRSPDFIRAVFDRLLHVSFCGRTSSVISDPVGLCIW